MKGLLTKDLLTIQKKYGMKRLVMDIAIIIALMIVWIYVNTLDKKS